MSLKKILFTVKLSFFPIKNLLNRIGIRYDFAAILNKYYSEDFKKVDIKDRAVLLPHCLINKKCPAKFSKENGVLCTSCGLCRCGEIRSICIKKGYQFYISPSVGFTKRLIQRKNLKAVIGAACDYEIKRGIKSEKVNSSGLHVKNNKVTPKLVYISKYDCIDNDVDWEKIIRLIED